MEVGDKFHQLGLGTTIVAPSGLKKIIEGAIGTIKRDEVKEIVTESTKGEPATTEEVREYKDVGELVRILSGFAVEYRKKITAEAQHLPGTIIINIESSSIREAKRLLEEGRKDLAMVRLIDIVAHEMAHETSSVHNIEFYKNYEANVSNLGAKIINLLKS